MKVQDITLIKSGKNSYDGLVTVSLQGNRHQVSITVLTDGSSMMWESKPLAFAFLMEYINW